MSIAAPQDPLEGEILTNVFVCVPMYSMGGIRWCVNMHVYVHACVCKPEADTRCFSLLVFEAVSH